MFVGAKFPYKCVKSNHGRKTYLDIEETTGHSKLHSDNKADRLSRYKILSHQAGMRFFSPESYPRENSQISSEAF